MAEIVQQKMPKGMIAIVIFNVWTGISVLFELFRGGPLSLLDNVTKVYLFISTLIGFIVVYGIIKRIRWARKLAIGWYTFTTASTVEAVISFFANGGFYNTAYQETFSLQSTYFSIETVMIITFVVLILKIGIGFLITFYLFKKKDFFIH